MERYYPGHQEALNLSYIHDDDEPTFAPSQAAVLAPMLAQVGRSCWSLSSPSRGPRRNVGGGTPSRRSLQGSPRGPPPSRRCLQPSARIPEERRFLPAHRQLEPFNYVFESDLLRIPSIHIPRTPPRSVVRTSPPIPDKVMTPERRMESTGPLLTPDSMRGSWGSLPRVHLPTELLCCLGFLLLVSGSLSSILCFYLLTRAGGKYFLYLGSIAGFCSLLLGLLSFRAHKWRWLPHRNYLTGYVLVCLFSLVQVGCLGGLTYSLESGALVAADILGGMVSGMSCLVALAAVLGLVTSGCCHSPPPDNRVAHRVAGFTV